MWPPLTFFLTWYVFLSLCLMWSHQCNWISLAPTELRWRTREKFRDQSCFEWCWCGFIKTFILLWKQYNVALWWPKKISSSHKVYIIMVTVVSFDQILSAWAHESWSKYFFAVLTHFFLFTSFTFFSDDKRKKTFGKLVFLGIGIWFQKAGGLPEGHTISELFFLILPFTYLTNTSHSSKSKPNS